jgi:hypothetical protein
MFLQKQCMIVLGVGGERVMLTICLFIERESKASIFFRVVFHVLLLAPARHTYPL